MYAPQTHQLKHTTEVTAVPELDETAIGSTPKHTRDEEDLARFGKKQQLRVRTHA